MKPRTKIPVAIAMSCLGLGVVAAVGFVGPEPHFVCHKVIDGALQTWTLQTSNAVWYPNINGSSSKSLAVLMPYMFGAESALRDYRYIPGLKSDDPKDLILFYMREPIAQDMARRYTLVPLRPQVGSP